MLVLPTQPRGGSVMFSFSSSSCTAWATTPTASLMCADSFLPLMSCSPMMPGASVCLEPVGEPPPAGTPRGPALTVRGVAQRVPRDLALPHQPHVPRTRHVQHRGCAIHGGGVVLAVGQSGVTGQDSSPPPAAGSQVPLLSLSLPQPLAWSEAWEHPKVSVLAPTHSPQTPRAPQASLASPLPTNGRVGLTPDGDGSVLIDPLVTWTMLFSQCPYEAAISTIPGVGGETEAPRAHNW